MKTTNKVKEENIMSIYNNNLFSIESSNFFPVGTEAKVNANLAAIKLVKRLEQDHRQATEQEQAILAKFVGWGGLANVFFDEYNSRFKAAREELKALVSEHEYKAMKRSSLTAYYTSPEVAKSIWKKIEADGFKGGNILDPSMGTGIFFATMPEHIRRNSTLFGIELEPLTGTIAKQLFPEATIKVQGFETIAFKQPCFDLVITNVPFANLPIADKHYNNTYLIHDYFIKKATDVVREGGLVAAISSVGTMDKRSGGILKELEETTAFLGGVRLPRNAFKKIAGTTITTDILFFQRDNNSNYSSADKAFSGSVKYPKDNRVFVNPYFLKDALDSDSSHVMGAYKVENFNGGTLSVTPLKEDLEGNLDAYLMNVLSANNAFGDIQLTPAAIQLEGEVVVDGSIPEEVIRNIRLYEYETDQIGNVYYKDSDGIRKSSKISEIAFFQDEDGQFLRYDSSASKKTIEEFEGARERDGIIDTYINDEASVRGKNAGLYKGVYFFEMPLSKNDQERIVALVAIKKAYQDIIDIQSNHDYSTDEYNSLLRKLNMVYDGFVKKYNFINSPVNANLFEIDDRFALIASLENEAEHSSDSNKILYNKSEAFFKPLIRPKKEIVIVNNANDALLSSLAEGRGVDFEFMQTVFPKSTKESLIDDLGENILVDVEQFLAEGVVNYVTKEEFLSGDVVTKYENVLMLLEKQDATKNWNLYKFLLEEVLPQRITLTDISYKIGSHWIPEKVLAAFAFEAFGGHMLTLDSEELEGVIMTNPITGRHLSSDFVLKETISVDYKFSVSDKFGRYVRNYQRGTAIFGHMLNSEQPTITKTIKVDEKPKTITDDVATQNLRQREAEIQEKFYQFVTKSNDVSIMVEDAYNKKYNRNVPKVYNGDNLVIDGLARNVTLRSHQRNAIQRILQDRRALLGHEVGSGKSLTMLGAAFKLKELGIINKPLFVVPTSLTANFGQEILKFFPTKNVFVTTKHDFIKARRKLFISRILTGDYDAIVIGTSQFEKIKVSQERENQFFIDKYDELDSVLEYARFNNDNLSVKKIEALQANLEAQLQKINEISHDQFIDFESLGVDFLAVDEAHGFKNVRPMTRHGNVVGITQKTSQKCYDMEMKVRAIQEEHDGENIIFATGTPLSNSISEMFTMMNYIQPDVLSQYDVAYFDSWVGAFGLIENSLEINPTGDKYVSRKRFTKFVNLPELMMIYKTTADIQTSEVLDIPVPKVKTYAIKNNMSLAQKNYIAELVERSDAIKGGGVSPSEDNMLKITSEARKLALDMRMIDDELYTEEDSSKLEEVVKKVMTIYQRESKYKGTQMIFSDIGTPGKSSKSFNIYNELRLRLVERGVPSEEVAFVHEANTDQKKNKMQRKVNAGEIRVLIASTEKGGTGLNVQKRMKAVHHLDVPWRPSDITQRNGRLIRQGNIYNTVEVYHYITTGTFDNYLWQLIEGKLKYVRQVLTNRSPIRAMDDIDEQTMTAADFKALATGNPYIKLKMELENEFSMLYNQQKAWKREYEYSIKQVEQSSALLAAHMQRVKKIEHDIELSKPFITDKYPFEMTFKSEFILNERTKAGNQLFYEMQSQVSSEPKMVTLATFKGFDLKMLQQKTPFINGRLLQLNIVGQSQYILTVDCSKDGSPVGTMRRIENIIKSLDKELTKEKSTIKYHENVIARGVASDTFSKQSRLDYIVAKLKVLNPMLANETEFQIEDIKVAIEAFEHQYNAVGQNQGEEQQKNRYDNEDTDDYDYGVNEDLLGETEEVEEASFETVNILEAEIDLFETVEVLTISKAIEKVATTGEQLSLFCFD